MHGSMSVVGVKRITATDSRRFGSAPQRWLQASSAECVLWLFCVRGVEGGAVRWLWIVSERLLGHKNSAMFEVGEFAVIGSEIVQRQQNEQLP